VGKLGPLEIDFVAEGPEGIAYYQVAESVAAEKTLERELEPLRSVPDNFPKYLLTLDDVDPVNRNGILQLNVLDWLASRNA
jgi:predicted AAA+ superfamily ATPase